MDWFLYDKGLRHESVKLILENGNGSLQKFLHLHITFLRSARGSFI